MTRPSPSRPGLSILVAAHNAEGTLEAALSSALIQRGLDFEIVVMDDGSDDSTLRIARRVASTDARVTVLTQENSGTARALNAALRAASGDLVARLDADDELMEDYLWTMSTFIDRNPCYDIYSHDLLRVTANGTESTVFGMGESRSFTLEEMLERNIIPGAGTIARRPLIDRLGGYRPSVLVEDYDLWLRALASGARHIYCPEALYRYRQSPGQRTYDAISQHQSCIAVINDLMENAALDDGQRTAAIAAISRNREVIAEIEAYGGTEGFRLAQRWAGSEVSAFRRTLGHVLPPGKTELAVRRLRRVARLIRPLRKMVWRLRDRAVR